MLSSTSRWLTYLNALLYAVTGAMLFMLPEQMAPVFAWKVTPFMAMTIGGWCLGNAWLAWLTARRWKWGLVCTTLVYLWIFGLTESAVLMAFHDKVRMQSPVAWLYIMTLAANALTAVVGVVDWARSRPAIEASAAPVGRKSYISGWAFFVFVAMLATYGMLAPVGAAGTKGGIFPEVMSPFTLRAFAAFYLSLALAALLLLTQRNKSTYLHHAIASYGLIVAITIASFVYFRVFDLAHRPGGMLYIGAYLIVGIPLIFVFRKLGLGSEPALSAGGQPEAAR